MPVVFRHSGLRFYFFSNEDQPPEPPHIHVKVRLGRWIESIRTRISRGGQMLGQRVRSSLKENCGRVGSLLQVVGQAKQMALLAAGIGTTTGVLSLLAPQVIAALTSGLTFALTVIGVQLAVRARQFCQRILPALS